MLATVEGDDIFCLWRCYPSTHGKIITWSSHNIMSKMGAKGTFLFFHYKSLFFLNFNYPPTWSIYFFLQLSRDRCYTIVSWLPLLHAFPCHQCSYVIPFLLYNLYYNNIISIEWVHVKTCCIEAFMYMLQYMLRSMKKQFMPQTLFHLAMATCQQCVLVSMLNNNVYWSLDILSTIWSFQLQLARNPIKFN
jgi:hypothetical protein